MVFNLISSILAQSTNDTTVTTSAIDTSGANLIVAVTTVDIATAALVADSKTNNWGTGLTTYGGGTGFKAEVKIWYCFNPVTDTAHTFSNNPSSGTPFPSIAVAAFSGAGSSPFDQENGHSDGDTTAQTIQSGSITPSQDNELVIAGLGWSGSSGANTRSIDGGFTKLLDGDSGAHFYGCALAYLIQTTATAANPTWDYNAGGVDARAGAAAIASFKIASSSRFWLMGPLPA